MALFVKGFICLGVLYLILSLLSTNTFAAVETYCGTNGCFTYNTNTQQWNCSQLSANESSTTDLTPCNRELGPYRNTCCRSGSCTAADGSALGIWDWNYAIACVAIKDPVFADCDFRYTYQTQTCGATDSCSNEPYLKPGLCNDSGCAIGPTIYKTCCYSNGNIDGVCQGGAFTGVCPVNTTTVICGISTCSGITAPCTVAACGDPACKAWFGSPATPPPAASLSLNSFSGAGCFSSGYSASLSWSGPALPSNDSGCPNGYWVDISSDSGFGNYSNKCVQATTTSAPAGFNPATVFNKNSTYYARIFNGSHSNTLSLNVPTNDCQGSPECGQMLNGSLGQPTTGSTVSDPVIFRGQYGVQPNTCANFELHATDSYISVDSTIHRFTSSEINNGSFNKSVQITPGTHNVFAHIEGYCPPGNILGDRNGWVELPIVGASCGSANITVANTPPQCNSFSLSSTRVPAGTSVRTSFNISDDNNVAGVYFYRDSSSNNLAVLSHSGPSYTGTWDWDTTGLTPNTTYTLIANATDGINTMLGISSTPVRCAATLRIDPPTPWIGPTCSPNKTFSGCNLQGQPMCTDYGDPNQPTWAVCNDACNRVNPPGPDSYCQQESGIIDVSSPLIKANNATSWPPLTISTTVQPNNNKGSVFWRSGLCSASSASSSYCTLLNWTAVPGLADVGSGSYSWRPPASTQDGVYTFGLLDKTNNPTKIYSVDDTTLQTSTGPVNPSPSPGGVTDQTCEPSPPFSCTTASANQLSPGCSLTGNAQQNLFCQQLTLTPNSRCQTCTTGGGGGGGACQSPVPPNDKPTLKLLNNDILEITYIIDLSEGNNPSFDATISRSNRRGFTTSGGEIGKQFGLYGNYFDPTGSASRVYYYQAQSVANNKSSPSNIVGVTTMEEKKKGSCNLNGESKPSLSSVSVSDTTPTTVTFKLTYLVGLPHPLSLTCGAKCTPRYVPPYLKISRSSGNSYIPWSAATNVSDRCIQKDSKGRDCIASEWTAYYTIDLPPNTSDNFTVFGYANGQCPAQADIGSKQFSASTHPGTGPDRPLTPIISGLVGRDANRENPFTNLTWNQTLAGEEVKIYRTDSHPYQADDSIPTPDVFDASARKWIFQVRDNLANRPSGKYYYGVQFRRNDWCSNAFTDQAEFNWVAPWIQTTEGDVHSNTMINTPGGP